MTGIWIPFRSLLFPVLRGRPQCDHDDVMPLIVLAEEIEADIELMRQRRHRVNKEVELSEAFVSGSIGQGSLLEVLAPGEEFAVDPLYKPTAPTSPGTNAQPQRSPNAEGSSGADDSSSWSEDLSEFNPMDFVTPAPQTQPILCMSPKTERRLEGLRARLRWLPETPDNFDELSAITRQIRRIESRYEGEDVALDGLQSQFPERKPNTRRLLRSPSPAKQVALGTDGTPEVTIFTFDCRHFILYSGFPLRCSNRPRLCSAALKTAHCEQQYIANSVPG